MFLLAPACVRAHRCVHSLYVLLTTTAAAAAAAAATISSTLPATHNSDGVCRVWDARTKACVHVLSGHTNTVCAIQSQSADPQVITGSVDTHVRLWDLAAGKATAVLTHHKKSVRALALHPTEFTFASGGADSIRKWRFPDGDFLQVSVVLKHGLCGGGWVGGWCAMWRL